jgi:hypothetical protein
MSDIIGMLMNYIGTWIGFDQKHIREASFSKLATVRLAIRVGPNVAPGLPRSHPIGVLPPRGLARYPVLRLKFERA